MTALAPIAGMAQIPQWINYKVVPLPSGKTDKIPVDPRTGANIDAQLPSAWMTYKQAAATGLPVGFVFTESDPYGFIDLDGCVDPATGVWNDIARYVMSLFPGCAMEISHSGTGAHIFYRIPAGAGPHSTRSAPLAAEMYTARRFVAFTGTGLVGNCDVTPDPATYTAFTGCYFPPKLSGFGESPEDWTTEPADGWYGPEDDEELLKRMRASKNVQQIMGIGIGPKELINMDDEKLAKAYPDTGGQERAFDWSKADAALCSHLAFWTGKDCERMLRIWGSLPLGQREKFNRSDYARSTILGACAMCKSVYAGRVSDRKAEPVIGEAAVAGRMREGYQFLDPTAQQEYFKGCVYVLNKHAVYVPGWNKLVKPEQFKTLFGGYVFGLDSINDKVTRNAWEAFGESQVLIKEIVFDICFRPDLEPGVIVERDRTRYVNIFQGIHTESTPGDAAPFVDFISRILPDQRDQQILISYMAAVVQYPGYKFYWCPVVQGTPGSGKGVLDSVMMECVGKEYYHQMESQDIANKFNAWVQHTIFCFVDEVKIKRNDLSALEVLKKLITNTVVPLQGKGQDQGIAENCVKMLLCSNYKDAVPKDENDRRFAVFYCAQQSAADLQRSGMAGDYFPDLWAWLRTGGYAVVNNFLRTYQIPAELNPATHCHRAPDTTATREAVAYNRGTVDQLIYEVIGEGRTGFCGGWISSIMLGQLFKENHIKMAYNKRADLLRDMGYVAHPALVKGRTNTPILIEGGKPCLYLQSGHIALNESRPMEIHRMYCEAQGYAIGDAATVGVGPAVGN